MSVYIYRRNACAGREPAKSKRALGTAGAPARRASHHRVLAVGLHGGRGGGVGEEGQQHCGALEPLRGGKVECLVRGRGAGVGRGMDWRGGHGAAPDDAAGRRWVSECAETRRQVSGSARGPGEAKGAQLGCP